MYNMADIPIGTLVAIYFAHRLPLFPCLLVSLGFGVTSRSTTDARKVDPGEIVCFHQADLGEYLREEATLV